MILRNSALGTEADISEFCKSRLNPSPDQIPVTLNTCEVPISNPVDRSGFAALRYSYSSPRSFRRPSFVWLCLFLCSILRSLAAAEGLVAIRRFSFFSPVSSKTCIFRITSALLPSCVRWTCDRTWIKPSELIREANLYSNRFFWS